MNKFFKRLALLLAVLMIVSMMPVQLFADNSVTGEGQSNGTGEASGNSNAVAKIGDTGYESLEAALAAANGNGTVTLLTATTELVQALLDGQYGSIDGLTIELPTGDYGKLELGRATKYAGSNTEYFVGGFDSTAPNYKAFASADEIREYKGQSAWTPNCFYRRALNNVTIKAADGATVTIEKISADAGQIYGKADAPKYDYVLDVEIPDTNKSYYMALAWNNVTFKGINFKSSVNIESSSEKTLIDGLHFEKCSFNSGYTALAAANDANATSKGMGIRFVSWTKTTNNLRNLTVNNCTFEDCSEGVYTNPVYGVSVTNSIFNNINHNAVAIQDDDSAVDHGNVVISDNHFENVGNRIIRFNNVGDGTTITITGNTSVNSGKKDNGEIIKATTMPDSVNVNMTSNTWGDVNGKTAVLGNGFKPTSTAVATVGGVEYTTLAEAIAAAKRNNTVTLLADTRENVTIDKALTLDLNGHTLNGGTEKGKPALTIITARVTVMDSSEAQTGTIMREDTAENSGVSSHYVIDIQGKNALLTFNSGNVRNNSGNAAGKGASLVRVGNDSDKKAHSVLTIAGGTFTQDNFIVIKVDFGTLHLKGGTVSSKNSYAVENWLNANIKENAVVNGAVSSWTYSGGSNSTLTISGGTVNGDVESISYDGTAGKKASVSITGGVVNGTLMTGIYGSATEPSKEMATIEVTGGTFTKDPTKYVIEDSAITKNADGTFGVAKAYLAEVDGNKYYTMEEAFKAQTASGKPIVLLRDYTTGSTFNSGTVARVVDLNGHTWTCTGTDANSAAFEINNANASLTVKNGKIVSSQLVGLIPSAMGGTIKYDNSSLTFENVEMSTTATSGIETNGNNTNDTVTLKNSTLNVPNGFGIYFPSSGTLTVENSKITAKTMGVQVCSGVLIISGADTAITVTGDAVPKTEDDGAIQDGAAISIVNRTGYKGLDTVTISGGKFTAKEGNSAIKAYDWANKTESDFTADKGTVAVSGGTFSSAVPADLCAEGLVPVANTDGTYGVKAGKYVAQIGDVKYETLADALAAANAGDTVTLLADINTPEKTYEITKSLTIDLNGKTVTGSGYDGVFEVTGENIKVVLDATNGGKVIAVENSGSAGKYAMAVWMCGAGSTLTINGGEFIQNITSTNDKQMDMIYASAGTIIINSGSFTSGTPKWTLNINDSAYKNGTANIIVTGGTFTGYDPRNAENEGKGTSLVADGVGIDKNADGTFTAKSGMAAQIVDENGGSVKAYATLAEAIAAAKSGATVTLLSNTRENVTISKELTLDLNGHTLSGGTTAGKAALTNYGKLTINDSSEAQTGTIKREDNNTGGYYVIDNKGKMTINGGNVINDSGKKGSSLIRNGGAEDDNAYPTLNIIGGTFTQLNFIAIKNDALSILNVSGGKITSNASAIQNWYKATITGGEINGQLWTDAFAWDGGKSTGNTTISGNAKFNGEIVMDITSKNVVPELNISGGDLNVTNWRITTEAANAGAKPAVSGGTFKHAIPEEYCADGFIPTQNDDGTYGVKEGKYVAQIGDVKYETLEEAFAAAKNGDTITLLEDCKSDRINLEDKSVTVVLNGKTLTSTAAYGVMFCAKNGNKITIDGTVEGSKLVGTLMITAKTDGHIEVNGGTYESNQYCPIYVNGAVNSENSTVTVKNAIIKATNISSDQDMGCGVYLAGYSTSVFENCTITAPITGIEIRAGKLTLNNCDVTGGNGEVTADANGNGTTVTNAALAISQHTTKKPIEVTINGGTFNGTAAVYQTDVQGTGSADVKIAVKSGTFNGTISGETDGTIAISGGKFKVKVDDKYFDGNHACSTDTTDGYYTVAGHPITKVGLTLGEDISIRIVVDAKYKDGKIKVTYETYDPNTKGMVTKELIINKCEYAGLDEEGNKKYQFRISNVTPQMADVVFTLQYLDSEGNKIGSAKQISIVEYCRKFAETNKFEAYKAKIGQLLNYCATAMDFRAVSHKDDMYNGLSWAKRATALRAKISEFGYTVADIDFGKVGQYSNAAIENIVTGFGIEFAESIKLYYFTAPDNYKDGYTYVADGLLTPVPVYEDGVLIGYRVYLTVAMDGYHAKRTLKVYDANGEEVQRIGMAPDYALKYLYNSDKQTTEFKQLCKAAYQYFIAFAE